MASGFSITRLKAKRQKTSFKSARKFISTQNFVPSKLSIRYEDRGRTLFRFSYFSFFFSYLKVITFNAPFFFVSVKCKNGLRQRNGIQKRRAVTQAKGIPKMVAERKTRFKLFQRNGRPAWWLSPPEEWRNVFKKISKPRDYIFDIGKKCTQSVLKSY